MTTPILAEQALLGGLMLDNGRFHGVAPLVTAAMFTAASRSRIWEALRDRILAGESADSVTMCELLESEGAKPEVQAYVIELASTTPSAASVGTYAKIVRDNWSRREGVRIAGVLMANLREAKDGAVEEAIGELLALSATQADCEYTLKQALHEAYQQIAAAYEAGGALPGITTGLSDLDDLLGGWHNGDLTLIGARPSMGKTAMMLNLAEAAARSGKRVGIVSAEQPAVQLGIRSISLASRVGAADLRRGRVDDDQWARINAGIQTAVNYPIRIYDRSAVTLDELVAVARKWKHTHGLDVLFLDYAQRVSVPGADRITEVSAIARGLKNLARDLNIPLIALAQVKAAVDSREDRRPNAGDLANSDELTREADEIIMLYREDVYFREKNERDQPVKRGIAELLIEKNRHGPTGFLECAFLAETMRFADLAR